MHKILYSFAVTLVLLSAAVATAAEKPEELNPLIKAQVPFGTGKLTEFFFHIYDAELWTDAPEWSYQKPFALTVTYGMSISRQDLIDSTLKEIFRQHEPTEQVMQSYAKLLEKAYADVKEGDRITALYTASGGIELFLNGRKTAESKDTQFARHFFDIWLSAETSEPSLRKKLLKASS